MRQISLVLFLFILIGTANAGTQIKTVEYFMGQDQATAVTATAVNFTGDSISVVLPESNIIVKGAWIELWEVFGDTIAASPSKVDIYLNNVQYSTITGNYYITNSGESTILQATANVTAAFATYSNPTTYKAIVKTTGGNTNAQNMKLKITYQYDDTSAVKVKTIRYPLDTITTSPAANTITNFNYNVYIPESSASVKSVWFQVNGRKIDSTNTDMVIKARTGSNTTWSGGGSYDGALYDAYGFQYFFAPPSADFSINTAQTFGVQNTGVATNGLGGEIYVTYTYNSNEPTQLRTVRYFIAQRTSGSNTLQSDSTTFYAPENGLGVKSVYSKLRKTWGATAVGTWTVVGKIGSTTTTSRVYTMPVLTAPETIADFEYVNNMTTAASSLVNNTIVFVNSTTTISSGALTKELIVTYQYDFQSAIQQKTVEFPAGQSTVGALIYNGTVNMSIPEYSIKRSAYLYYWVMSSRTSNPILASKFDSTYSVLTPTLLGSGEALTSVILNGDADNRINPTSGTTTKYDVNYSQSTSTASYSGVMVYTYNFVHTPINITSHGNNITNNNSLSITVNQSDSISFNLTSNMIINSNTTSASSGIIGLSNGSLGSTEFWANFSFPNYSLSAWVNLILTNTTTETSDSRNWSIVVNDVTPPGQVTNVTNSTPPTTNAINLVWNAVQDNTGGSGILDYLIFMRNNSINWLTKPRPTIDATTSHNNYTDAYRYNARLAVPVSCIDATYCHGATSTTPTHYPFYLKYNESYLYLQAMVADNDSGTGDDYIEIVIDPSKDGGTTPQSDDRYYEFWEDNTTKNIMRGNGIGWENYTSEAIWDVKRYENLNNSNITGNMYEIRIPLSELNFTGNDSTVRFAIEHECNEGTAENTTLTPFISRASYLPDTADDNNPNTWTLLLTYRNNTVWDYINKSPTNSYEVTDLLPSFRYYFTVFARDIALNNGTQSIVTSRLGTITTSDKLGYRISGYVTSAGTPLNGAHVQTREYIVHTDSNGFYTLTDLINGTYTVTASASDCCLSNSTNITLNGADQSNVNLTLQDVVAPSVTSNSNDVLVLNDSRISLNATITDLGSGVKNATVNISAINSTINEAIMTYQGSNIWNISILADRGESNGFVNLTITAYDYFGNVNNTVNMTVQIVLPPNLTSWGNDKTNNDSLDISVIMDEIVNFNVTVNQTIAAYLWTYDGTGQGTDMNSFQYEFLESGLHYVNVSASNANGTATRSWMVNVLPKTIDVTLSNVPVVFGNLLSGSSNQAALLPLTVTIQGTTNVNVNIILNGSDFIYDTNSFNVENLVYSNSSDGIKTSMETYPLLPPYEDWVNISKLVSTDRSIYMWLSIPLGQEPGGYNSSINVCVEEFI